MDDFDKKILRCVQRDAGMTAQALAGEVGLSASACQRRLVKLREEGIIQKEVAVLDPRHTGQTLTMVVQAAVSHGRGDIVDGVKRDALKSPLVQQCYYVTGSFDFTFIVTVTSMSEYEEFIREMFHENPNIARFETAMVMNRVKVGLELPI